MKLNTELTKDYYNWLVYGVLQFPLNDTTKDIWEPIMHGLFLRDYVPVLIMDESRACDGCDLRDLFMMNLLHNSQIVPQASPWDNKCSILEMMVALVCRMYEEFYVQYKDIYDVRNILFKTMLMSLGFSSERPVESQEFNQIIDNFMLRTYEPNGRGSLFYMGDKSKDDWREPPVWNQMLAFVSTHQLFADEE
jgi:hypothetical protein